MTKTTPQVSRSPEYDQLGSFEERLQLFLHEYGSRILYITLFVLVIFVWMYRINSGRTAEAQTDFLNAQAEFTKFQENPVYDPNETDSPFAHLEEILKRHPELHAKYDGLIAQTMLLKGDLDIAKKYADMALKRTANDKLPFYSDYTKTSLLIAGKDYPKSMDQALDLRKLMNANAAEAGNDPLARKFGDTLYALNELRIALLQPFVGTPQEELAALKELQAYTHPSENAIVSPVAFNMVLAQLQEGTVSLQNYIAEKEKVLTKIR
jgi:hypothetical protein